MATKTAFERALKHFESEADMARSTGYTKQAINIAKQRGRFSRALAVKLNRLTGIPEKSLRQPWKVDKRNGALRPVK